MKLRYKGFCSKCHYTIWQNERVVKEGNDGFSHRDCLLAIKDATPRSLNPKYEQIIGKVNKGKLREKWENRLSQQAGLTR